MKDYKVMFLGCSNSGKTTAIMSVSDIEAISTDVKKSQHNRCGKEMTTVGLDYGEVTLPGMANRFRLYGTPGQQRFSFMWNILGLGSAGVILLSDNSRRDPISELRFYLDSLKERVTSNHLVVVVGIVKSDLSPYPDKSCYQQLLDEFEFHFPIIHMDARVPSSVLLALRIISSYLDKNLGENYKGCSND